MAFVVYENTIVFKEDESSGGGRISPIGIGVGYRRTRRTTRCADKVWPDSLWTGGSELVKRAVKQY